MADVEGGTKGTPMAPNSSHLIGPDGLWAVCTVLGLPMLATAVFAASESSTVSLAGRAAGSVLIALAPAAVGAFGGLLFGVPKWIAASEGRGGGADNPIEKPPQPATTKRMLYVPNTSLEQISDWLTKVLVGAGLVELSTLKSLLHSAARFESNLLGGTPAAVAVCGAAIVYFLVAGFLCSFLTIKLRVARMMAEEDNAVLNPPPPNQAAVGRIIASSDAAGTITDADKAELLKYRLDQLHTARDVIAWGQTKLSDGDHAAAGAAFSRALSLAAPGSDPDAARRAAESLMLASLYDPQPDGFQRAIDTATRYFSDRSHADSAALRAWLACAYGQAYTWERAHGAPDARLAELRDKALECVKRALEIDGSWRGTLGGVLEPATENADDDLAAFRDDPAFRAALTLPPKAASSRT